MTRLSIVVPTVSRPTLKRTLDSIAPQLHEGEEGDEVIVIGDGHQPDAKALVANYGPNFWYTHTAPTGHWGNEQRNKGMDIAIGTHICFMDDDDVYTPGALDAIRETIEEHGEDRPLMFKMLWYDGELVLWRTPDVYVGNVGTPMFVVPNDPWALGRYTERYQGDYDWITSTLLKYKPGDLVWIDHVICHCRPK